MKETMFDGPVIQSNTNLQFGCSSDADKQAKLGCFNEYYTTIGDNFSPTCSANIEVPMKEIANNVQFKFKSINLIKTKQPMAYLTSCVKLFVTNCLVVVKYGRETLDIVHEYKYLGLNITRS